MLLILRLLIYLVKGNRLYNNFAAKVLLLTVRLARINFGVFAETSLKVYDGRR